MAIEFPSEWRTEKWYNGIRHWFKVDGYDAWIVEPEKPAADGRWSWVTIWPEAFVPRVGVVEMLDQGYYHGHVDVLTTRATPDKGTAVMRKFHDICTGLGLAQKANLIGMSWGGLFALRFAADYPEMVACIYLDAPVCNMGDDTEWAKERRAQIAEAFGLPEEQLLNHPLNPIHNVEPLVKAGIPIFAATGEHDLIVPVDKNINLLEEAIKKAGGSIKIIRRPGWGHHPHGFDDRTDLLQFMNQYAAGKGR